MRQRVGKTAGIFLGTHAFVSTQHAPHIPQNKTHTVKQQKRPVYIQYWGNPLRAHSTAEEREAEYKLGLSGAHRDEGEVPNTIPILKPAAVPTLM